MEEIFKEIDGFSEYSISTNGKLMSNSNWIKNKSRILKPIIQSDGYVHFTLCKERVKYQLTAHRIVAETFIPNPQNKPCINHINGIKTDNRVENLEWCTHKENTQHASKLGLMRSPKYYLGKKGKLHPNSKKLEVTTHNGIYVGVFYGTAEASRVLKISQAHISRCCTNNAKSQRYKFTYI